MPRFQIVSVEDRSITAMRVTVELVFNNETNSVYQHRKTDEVAEKIALLIEDNWFNDAEIKNINYSNQLAF